MYCHYCSTEAKTENWPQHSEAISILASPVFEGLTVNVVFT